MDKKLREVIRRSILYAGAENREVRDEDVTKAVEDMQLCPAADCPNLDDDTENVIDEFRMSQLKLGICEVQRLSSVPHAAAGIYVAVQSDDIAALKVP